MNNPKNGLYGKFPKFTPCQEMYVFHNEVGRVLEISMDGVSFTYIADDRPLKEFLPEGMLFTHGGKYIHDIPFERISDHVHGRFFPSDYIRERRVRFGELSAGLVKQLECFILENAHIPQLSYDARYMAYKSVYASTGPANFDNTVRERVSDDSTDLQLARYGEFPRG